jgi:uncharacterized membrane protein YfcA
MGFVNWVRTQWDRAIALGALIIGLLALLIGWIGVSGNAYVAKQLPYVISGALFGIFMIGAAGVMWLSADLRDEWRELRGIRLLLRENSTNAAANGHFGPGDGPADRTVQFAAVGVGPEHRDDPVA